MTRPTPVLSLTAVLSLAACAGDATAPPAHSTTAAMEVAASGIWARQIVGETGPGAEYAFYVPQGWNGDVVYYAHGILPAAAPVALPTADKIDSLRDALGERGVAVAYSSFSENGWAVKDGAQRTHQLRGLFTAQVGPARHSYLLGHSMGGLVAEDLAERYPGQYDGTLAMCAPLGGGASEVNYLADVRVLFDWFYPGVVPGNVMYVPEGTDVNRVIASLPGAVVGKDGGAGLGAIARIRQTPLAGQTPTELFTSLSYAIGYNMSGLADFLDRTHGHPFYDNHETWYQAAAPGLLPEDLITRINDRDVGVGRWVATPDALNYLDRYYTPSGALGIPTVTLHTTRDPLVPVKHEAEFADAVSSAGASPLLLRRTVSAFGHCAFKTAEMTSAFDALRSWVETGVRPEA
jgi:pimeloyl-ACP methyl ester carboxylesterase